MLPRFADNSPDVDRAESNRDSVHLWAGVTLGLVFVGLTFGWFYGRAIRDQADMAGAKSQVAIGTVTGLTYLPGSEANPLPDIQITVEWDGHREQFVTRTPPKSGQAVRVRYVVGRSGKYYVKSVDLK